MESQAKVQPTQTSEPCEQELSFRPFEPSDLDALVVLFERSFGHRRSAQEFRHKFIDNPAGLVVAACALEGERLAGFYAVIPQEFSVGGERVLGAQSVDTMVDPDFRGRGLFRKLANATIEYAHERGVRFLIGYPNANSYPGFVRRLNWTHIGDASLYYRILTPSKIEALPVVARPLLSLATQFLPKGSSASFRVEEEEIHPERLANLACSIEPQGVTTLRSKEWFAWRYADAENRSFTAYEGKEAVAAVLLKVNDEGVALILDILGKKESAKVAAMHRLILSCAKRKCSGIRAVIRSQEDEKILRRLAFVRRRRLPYIVRHLGHRTLARNVFDIEQWDIHGGDSDAR